MKTVFFLLLVAIVMHASGAPKSESSITPTNAPSLIELHDQFDAPQKLSFPTTNVTLLTIADKKGSEQIAGWVTSIKQRFGKSIDIRGVADVSAVPRPLRGLVRNKFQKVHSYPVMMDWTGDVVKAFTYAPEKANVLVLGRDGAILGRFSGAASTPSIAEVCAVLNKALANTTQITTSRIIASP